MQISVKLVGPLADRLPAGSPVGDNALGVNEISVADDCDVGQLLSHLGLAPDLEYFAMINEQHVPSETLARRVLSEGDAVVLLPPLKGG